MHPFGKRLLSRRILETLAIVLIGDGVVALLQPRRHVRLWEAGPEPWRRLMRDFEIRPGLTRVLSLAEVGLGLWLASRQRPPALHKQRAWHLKREQPQQ